MSAKTVEEAIEVALKELDADRTEVEIETLSPGKPGFLGIRSEPARVRVRKIPAAQGAAGMAMEIVNSLLAATGARTVATLKSARDPDAGGPSIDITGDDSGLLIGRRGETLRALQFMVNLILRNRLKEEAVRVVLDIERYKERRHSSLKDMALRVADKVAGTGRAVSLEPMPAVERRVVHMALAEHPRVTTESTGLGDKRKVVIVPKDR